MSNYKNHYLILVFCLLTKSVISAQQKYFELNGESYKHLKKEKIFLNYINYIGTEVTDSVEIENDKFYFKGLINFPTKAFIGNNSAFRLDGFSTAIIYLEPKTLYISTDSFNFNTLKLNQSKTYDEYLIFKKKTDQNTFKRDSILKLKNELSKKVGIENGIEDKVVLLEKYIEKYNDNEIDIELDFSSNNSSSFLIPDLLLFRLKRRDGFKLYNKLSTLYNHLSKDVKKSPKAIELNQTLIYYLNSKIGSYAPHFSLKDINNNDINLKTFKNKKYILIDFWASWCIPCREDFPFLKEIYSKYKKDEFEILSISRDEKTEAWKNVIEKDNIKKWINVSIKENNSNIENKYFVTAIPVKILIDKNGLIIGRWRGGGVENKKEIEKKLQEIFEKK